MSSSRVSLSRSSSMTSLGTSARPARPFPRRLFDDPSDCLLRSQALGSAELTPTYDDGIPGKAHGCLGAISQRLGTHPDQNLERPRFPVLQHADLADAREDKALEDRAATAALSDSNDMDAIGKGAQIRVLEVASVPVGRIPPSKHAAVELSRRRIPVAAPTAFEINRGHDR